MIEKHNRKWILKHLGDVTIVIFSVSLKIGPALSVEAASVAGEIISSKSHTKVVKADNTG